MRAVLVADIGSTVLKAAVVTPDGRFSARRSAAAPGGPEVATQDAEGLWRRAQDLLAEVVASWSGSVDGIVITGQGDGLWTVDADGNGGTAFQWNSVAGAAAVDRWTVDGTADEHFARSGTVLWPGTSAALWHHLRAVDPDRARRVRWAFTAGDWVVYRLTGRATTDVSNATIPFLDPWTRAYDDSSFDRLGCPELRERVPVPGEPGALAGTLLPDVARRLGLPPTTPVHLGCVDVVAAVVGSGAHRAGDAVAVLGTTTAVTPLTEDPTPAGDPVGATVAWVTPDLHLRVLGSSSGGAVLEWFLDTHGYVGGDRYGQFWTDVATSRSGSEVALPFLYGERVPFLAPAATGVFAGITPRTTRADLARALAEGLSMALRQCLESSGHVASMVLTGGGSTEDRWCRLIADVLGVAVTVDDDPNMAMRGAASLVPGYAGLRGAGGERRVVEPGEASPRLTDGYRRYRELTEAILPVWKGWR